MCTPLHNRYSSRWNVLPIDRKAPPVHRQPCQLRYLQDHAQKAQRLMMMFLHGLFAWKVCGRCLRQKTTRKQITRIWNINTFHPRFGYVNMTASRSMPGTASHASCRSSVQCSSVMGLFFVTRLVRFPLSRTVSSKSRNGAITSVMFGSKVMLAACRSYISSSEPIAILSPYPATNP